MIKNSQYISIQMIRGIAALIVVLFHSHIAIDPMANDYKIDIPFIYSRGHWAVYLFFVVSGFIITHVTYGKKFDIGYFLEKRILRIYPVWWLSFGFALVGLYVFNVSFSYGSPTSLSYFLQSFFLIPGSYKPINSVGWTLIFEVLFYAVAAIVLVRYSHKALVGVLLALFFVGSYFYSISPEHPYLTNPLGHHLFSPLQLLFVAGVGIYLFQNKLSRIPPLLAFALAIVTTVGIVYSPSAILGKWEFYFIVCGVGLASSLLILSTLNAEKRGYFNTSNWIVSRSITALRMAGDWSFSLYVFHWGIMSLAGSMFTHAYLKLPSWSAELWRFGIIAVSLFISMLSYKYLEAPISRNGGKFLKRLRQVFNYPAIADAPNDVAHWSSQQKLILVAEILRGNTGFSEAGKKFNIDPKQIEIWYSNALRGMDESLQRDTLIHDRRYEEKLNELRDAYCEAMLEIRAHRRSLSSTSS